MKLFKDIFLPSDKEERCQNEHSHNGDTHQVLVNWAVYRT